MKRRALLLGLSLPLLGAGQALAQEEAPRRAPRQRRPDPRDEAFMGGGMVLEPTPSLGNLGNQSFAANRFEPAPRPNIAMEAPRGIQQPEGARLTPGMIAPRIPGRGLAQDTGSPGSLQDRLFRPSPGAHLRIPISW